MKYLLLAYTQQSEWDNLDTSDPEFIAGCEFYAKLHEELVESGEFVSTEGLAHPALARTLRNQQDGVLASDGPYAEFKEQLASFAIVDCASHERVQDIAARICAAIGDTIEIRPIMAGPEEFA